MTSDTSARCACASDAGLIYADVSLYLVLWVASFLGEHSCKLVFQGGLGPVAPVNVGAPHGFPIAPLALPYLCSPPPPQDPRRTDTLLPGRFRTDCLLPYLLKHLSTTRTV